MRVIRYLKGRRDGVRVIALLNTFCLAEQSRGLFEDNPVLQEMIATQIASSPNS